MILGDILTFCHPNFRNFKNSSSISSLETCFAQGKKKNHVYKNQGHEPIHQKYQANQSTNRHNQKKKKPNNQQKIRKRKLYANMTLGYEMTIK
jgi:hypothetical protein